MPALKAAFSVLAIGCLVASTASSQQQWDREQDQKLLKIWETEVGGLFDKFDRDKNGSWGAREARLGTAAMIDNVRKYVAINIQAEQQLENMPRVVSGGGQGGVIRGDASHFTTPFVPPKGPYETEGQANADQFGGERKAANPAPAQDATKDQVVKYYVTQIHRLYAYNKFLTAQMQTRQNSLRPNTGTTRR